MKQPPVNRAQPDRWKEDIARSVDLYNAWFMKFAPTTFREARVRTTKQVEDALKTTANLTNIQPETLAANPGAEIIDMGVGEPGGESGSAADAAHGDMPAARP